MNNSRIESLLDDCDAELGRILTLIQSLGPTSDAVPYLNKYSIIRCCGVVEVSYKHLIADYCDKRSKLQLKTYIKKKVRESSANPRYEMICRMLKDFDPSWHKLFTESIQRHPQKSQLKSSLESLVEVRNEFAHGGNPSTTVADIKLYFSDSREIIKVLDTIIG